MRNASLMLLVLSVGCGGAQQAESSEELLVNTSEIINGTPTSDLPAVVALYGHKPGEQKGALCTATVVSPTILLTAAHCVHPETVGEGNEFGVFTTNDITDPNNRGTPLPVKEVHWNEKWSAQNLMAGADIAVVILDQPTTIPPMPFNRAPLPTTFTGTPAKVIGYGLNDGFGQTGAGIKRQATIKLNSFDDQFVKTGSWFGTTICSGDSGGPVFVDINGVQTIVGVNSFGFIYCLGEASSTRVDANLVFVNKYLPAPVSVP
ncbi:MAG: S1 family peptidase [Myxococcaceae bacterium]